MIAAEHAEDRSRLETGGDECVGEGIGLAVEILKGQCSAIVDECGRRAAGARGVGQHSGERADRIRVPHRANDIQRSQRIDHAAPSKDGAGGERVASPSAPIPVQNSTLSQRLLFRRVNRFFTTGFLPQRFRDELGLPWSPARQRGFEMIMRGIGGMLRLLPEGWRAYPFDRYLEDMRRRQAAGKSLV